MCTKVKLESHLSLALIAILDSPMKMLQEIFLVVHLLNCTYAKVSYIKIILLTFSPVSVLPENKLRENFTQNRSR